eukprot:365270-Chlamydomonas_euryale.AAC.1
MLKIENLSRHQVVGYIPAAFPHVQGSADISSSMPRLTSTCARQISITRAAGNEGTGKWACCSTVLQPLLQDKDLLTGGLAYLFPPLRACAAASSPRMQVWNNQAPVVCPGSVHGHESIEITLGIKLVAALSCLHK